MTSVFLELKVDDALLKRAKNGQTAAFGTLYDMFSRPIYNLAYRMVQNREVAEEVLQETFVDVMRKLGGFRGDAPFGAWVRRIAINRTLMYLRSAWNRYSQPMEGGALEAAYDARQSHSGDHHTVVDIDTALGKLTEVPRTVVWLHDVEGYTHQEIGELMGKSASFSKSQLARAYKRLRELTDSSRESGTCMHQ
ncbi:MAG: RNA polymerase sigma factor [Pseudomonadota bacterium]